MGHGTYENDLWCDSAIIYLPNEITVFCYLNYNRFYPNLKDQRFETEYRKTKKLRFLCSMCRPILHYLQNYDPYQN